jgi:nucleotide-binding universal stress UspA family protein
MFKHILLAFDGSDHARKAALVAGQMAREQVPPALLRVAVVAEPIYGGLGEPNFSEQAARRSLEGQELLDAAVSLAGAGIEVHTEMLLGPVAQKIIEMAEVRECDLIVMGSRGLTGLTGLLLGSQTQKVISLASCPVLVVR